MATPNLSNFELPTREQLPHDEASHDIKVGRQIAYMHFFAELHQTPPTPLDVIDATRLAKLNELDDKIRQTISMN